MPKRKRRTPETQQKTVLFGAASETNWAENRKEYVPEGEYVTKFALKFACRFRRGRVQATSSTG